MFTFSSNLYNGWLNRREPCSHGFYAQIIAVYCSRSYEEIWPHGYRVGKDMSILIDFSDNYENPHFVIPQGFNKCNKFKWWNQLKCEIWQMSARRGEFICRQRHINSSYNRNKPKKAYYGNYDSGHINSPIYQIIDMMNQVR